MDPHVLSAVARLPDHELLARVKQCAARERETTGSLIAHLAELDERRLYLAEGYSSLFVYCTQVLHFSEHAAYGRIQAARAVRRFPLILERLEDGSVNLTTVGLLAAYLTPENYQELLDMIRHRSKRQVEELVARRRPQPPVPSSVRKLPTGSHTPASPIAQHDAPASPQPTVDPPAVASSDLLSAASAPPRQRPAVVAPLAPERYKIQFTATAETYEKLRLARDLLRHQIPDGDPAKIFDRALTALLQSLAKKKLGATNHPRTSRGTRGGSRHIPAAVKRVVWSRDGGRCAFVSSDGRRCIEEGFLEFHHVTPFAGGGEPTAENIQLRCRAHNGYEAELAFGLRHRLVAREEHASYVSLPPSRAHRRGWGIPAATRSGPSTESAAARPWASVPRRLNPGRAGEKAAGSPGRCDRMSEAPPKAPQLTPTIYTQPGCRFCNAAKAWLTERDIPFTERDITKDPVAQDELERMGLFATPAIVIDGQVILGFDAKALEAALVQKRMPAQKTRQAASTDQGP